MPNATAPEKKWYVFDEADCFDSFPSARAAADAAEQLVNGGFEGVHTAYMTQAQFQEYCQHGNLKTAFTL